MKKFIYLIVSVFILAVVPLNPVAAKPMAPGHDHTISDAHQQHLMAQLSQQRQTIKQKMKDINKLQAQINKKSKTVTDMYSSLFQGNASPNDIKIMQLEEREAEITKDVQKLILVEKNLTKQHKMAKMHVEHQHYEAAVADHSRIINLLERKYQLMKKHDADLSSYIQFIESLDLK